MSVLPDPPLALVRFDNPVHLPVPAHSLPRFPQPSGSHCPLPTPLSIPPAILAAFPLALLRMLPLVKQPFCW